MIGAVTSVGAARRACLIAGTKVHWRPTGELNPTNPDLDVAVVEYTGDASQGDTLPDTAPHS